MYGLLSLILLFCNFACLLFIYDSPFLGFSYILVYIGAICVLFLYIILLLDLRVYSLIQRSNFILLVSTMLLIFILCIISSLFEKPSMIFSTLYNINLSSELTSYSKYLFGSYQLYFLLAIFLLLVALILALFNSSIVENHQLKNMRLLIVRKIYKPITTPRYRHLNRRKSQMMPYGLY